MVVSIMIDYDLEAGCFLGAKGGLRSPMPRGFTNHHGDFEEG